MAIEVKAPIRLYSIAVAPDLFLANFVISVGIARSRCLFRLNEVRIGSEALRHLNNYA